MRTTNLEKILACKELKFSEFILYLEMQVNVIKNAFFYLNSFFSWHFSGVFLQKHFEHFNTCIVKPV